MLRADRPPAALVGTLRAARPGGGSSTTLAMRGHAIRATTFAGITFLLMLLADVLMWGGYQGGHLESQRNELLWTHGVFHTGVLLLSMICAFVGFIPVRERFISISRVVVLAIVFAIATFFAVASSFQVGGIAAAALWLLVGSSVMTFVGGRMLSSSKTHG